jgi:hypoxanthine phosphoribosyltransferase
VKYEGVLKVTWQQFDAAIGLLATHIRSLVDLKGWVLTGQPRGGLVIAVCLSHQLDLPFVGPGHTNCYPRVIWVDDILDTGKTLAQVRMSCPIETRLLPCFWLARERWKKDDYIVATYVPEKVWVVFPWEVQDESRART